MKCQILFSGQNKKKNHLFVICGISPVKTINVSQANEQNLMFKTQVCDLQTPFRSFIADTVWLYEKVQAI